MLSDVMKQVDSGEEQTWGIKDDLSLWALVDDKWDDQNTQMKYISSGKAGIWGISSNNDVLVKEGKSTCMNYFQYGKIFYHNRHSSISAFCK